jgi:hypothetical protein
MMSPHLERAANTLFPANGGHVANVKFFLGSSRAVTAEQLAEQLNRANSQVKAGLSTAVDDIDC